MIPPAVPSIKLCVGAAIPTDVRCDPSETGSWQSPALCFAKVHRLIQTVVGRALLQPLHNKGFCNSPIMVPDSR